jgi:flagellar hook-associated protein 3 FlgL
MRVTDNTLTKNFLFSVNASRLRMGRLQEQLSSGKRLSAPSDDPDAANRILRAKNAIAKNDQYRANIEDGTAMMHATAHGLDQFSDLMLEAKEILTKARSGSRTETLDAFADQIDQLITNAVQTANTKFNGKYLFGGTQTTNPPFILAADRSAVTINPDGITGKIEVPVGEGLVQRINIDGQEAFLGTQIFQTLIEVRDALRNDIIPTDAQFDAVSGHLSHVSDIGGRAGLTLNALEMHDRFLEGMEQQLTSLLSSDEDTDFAEATMLLRKEELMLEAALNVGARLLPKTLMDFLR